MNRISAFIEKASESTLSFCHVFSRRWMSMNQEAGTYQTLNLLELLSRTGKKDISVIHRTFSLWYSVFTIHKLEKGDEVI